MLVFNKYFYKKKMLKLYFGDRVAVLNDFIYQTGGSKPKDDTHCCLHGPFYTKIMAMSLSGYAFVLASHKRINLSLNAS
jgi:hypothetical protein